SLMATFTAGQAYTVDKTAPVVVGPLTSTTTLISPQVSPGLQDSTTFGARITDANPVVWVVTVTDGAGSTVRVLTGTGADV
ncbi:hypothetical protein, partial [Acinetobacter baumannii]|uniref:hypothetical protein n=1 Tax=Acinetobacter baumannii TaxID=470 RepID=UPI003D6C6355